MIFTLAPYTHKGNEEKHHRILKYLEPLFLDVFRSVPNKERIQESISNYCPIWVLWWQGLESAPLIVQRCVESIKRNFLGAFFAFVVERQFRKIYPITGFYKAKG